MRINQRRNAATMQPSPNLPSTTDQALEAKATRIANLAYIVQRVQLRGQTSVDAEELLIDQRGQWKTIEGVHARVVDALGALDDT